MLTISRRGIHAAMWGAAELVCGECGRRVPAQEAVWHGSHPYCSAEHEALDTAELPVLS